MKTLGKIEFDKILEMLSDCCGSVLGKEMAGALHPNSDYDHNQVCKKPRRQRITPF